MICRLYQVAGHVFRVALCHSEDESLLSSYVPFLIDDAQEPLFRIDVADTVSFEESVDEIGQFDCGGCNHGVYRTKSGGYRFEISNVGGSICAVVETNADFTENRVALTTDVPTDRAFGLNNAIMIVYAFATAPYGTVLIHASVVRHAGTGYLFLGVSGTGKSTHTRLWLKYILGSDLMNDDNPVVRSVKGKTMVYGSPWSGKTPCYRNVQAPVGAFVQLEQQKENRIRREATLYAFAHLLSSVSTMKWDRDIYNRICSTISDFLKQTPVYHLGCLPDEAAARLCYETVVHHETAGQVNG